MKRNLWTQGDAPFAVWTANLASTSDAPTLFRCVTDILASGERHRVFLPRAVPALGLDDTDTSALVAALEDAWDRNRTVDLFRFNGIGMAPGTRGSSTVAAELAWYDREGRVTGGEIADLATLLEPDAAIISRGFREAFPPVRIIGTKVSFTVELHSDIWWPFIFGSAHTRANMTHYFDNRELAARHTPRLNAFLRETAAAVVAAGGTWEVDRDETGTDSGRWVSDGGIALDGPVPPLFPEEAWDDEWY
jgi:hypothetical protein